MRRIESENIQNYEKLFPFEERQNLVFFAAHPNRQEIYKFCLMATKHPEFRSIILNHYSEDTDSDVVERFIASPLFYSPGNWTWYSQSSTLLDAFKNFIEDDVLTNLVDPETLLKYKLLP